MTTEIPLTRGFVALVDDEDLAALSLHKWHARVAGPKLVYARACIGRGKIEMHRVLCGDPKGQVVDHINGNTLDNRRSNLRICSMAENRFNSPGWSRRTEFKGVRPRYRKKRPTFDAVISSGGFVVIGTFTNKYAAAVAHDDAAISAYGQFARLNFADCNERWRVRFASTVAETDDEVCELLHALNMHWSAEECPVNEQAGK